MADKQDGLRKHIKSAKGWLGRAESSLDNNNEVRGDLSIMLAQAELQHAQEVKHKSLWLIWLKRLSPVLLALLVGAGYMALLRPTDARVIYVKPQVVSSDSMAGPKDSGSDNTGAAGAKAEQSKSAAGADSPENIAPERQTAVGPYGEGSSEDTAENAAKNMESQYSLPASEEGSPAEGKRTEQPAEMQKLMQSAGKILRE